MAKTQAGFGADVARRVVDITYRQLDYWDKTGLVRPSIKKARGKGSRRVYSFEDLVELRVIGRLLAAGVSLPTVRRVARHLREHFKTAVRPLARLALIVEGKSILVRTLEGKHLLDATANGQLMISFAVGPIAQDLRGKVTALSAPRSIFVRVQGRAYEAILTPDLVVGGYSIEVPSLPGVFTDSDTLKEARAMVADAIRLRLAVQATPTLSRKAH